ncbi:MAG: insulinase family protein [Bacteroidia bacterium]|nr:insulinase family protein [Bacteroidia bacterium]
MNYTITQLENGLTLIHHEDRNTNLCVSNLLYNVGARDEDPKKTGFAHLFEHLMFGGSVNIPSFDTPLQKASGENNAFTSNDITNYYITLPSQNIETALWLESDRMLRLDFSEKSLNVQKGVVVEEFKQRYLNQPYGDSWLELRPLSYQVHPYQWATIGKEIRQIEEAKLEDVIEFFEKFYNPSNAVLCLAGNIGYDEALLLTKKWFSDIPSGPINSNAYAAEPPQLNRREKTIEAEVPQDALYMAFHMLERIHPLYFAFDLLSDILSGTESSRFINVLVKEKALFTHIHAYITGEIDQGLFIIEGKIADGIEFETAENAVMEILNEIVYKNLSATELEKVKNKVITSNLFAKTSVLNKAMALCYAYRLGDIELINKEIEILKSIRVEDIRQVCQEYLLTENRNVLKYKSKK